MVFGVVTNDGDVMPSYIFSHGLRINIEKTYIKYLENIALLWIEIERPYVW